MMILHIEILDLYKNKSNLISCKTSNGYASNPYSWYDHHNPFVINIFNEYWPSIDNNDIYDKMYIYDKT